MSRKILWHGASGFTTCRRKVCCAFLSPLKIHHLSWVWTLWTLGPIHTNYTTEATIMCSNMAGEWKPSLRWTRSAQPASEPCLLNGIRSWTLAHWLKILFTGSTWTFQFISISYVLIVVCASPSKFIRRRISLLKGRLYHTAVITVLKIETNLWQLLPVMFVNVVQSSFGRLYLCIPLNFMISI
jgi:hypothetical protein